MTGKVSATSSAATTPRSTSNNSTKEGRRRRSTVMSALSALNGGGGSGGSGSGSEAGPAQGAPRGSVSTFSDDESDAASVLMMSQELLAHQQVMEDVPDGQEDPLLTMLAGLSMIDEVRQPQQYGLAWPGSLSYTGE